MYYTGWPHRPYKLDRALTRAECSRELKQIDRVSTTPNKSMYVCCYNSSYIECIDHRYHQRGGLDTALKTWGGVVIFLFCAFVSFYFFPVGLAEQDYPVYIIVLYSAPIFLLSLVGSAWYWFDFLRYDYFVNTHNPIRFNRKNRKVYVYRDRYSGGLLEANFDDVFFHIALEGKKMPVASLRGHVIEDDKVVDTFAVGIPCDKENEIWIYQFWEFLCRYMNDGPDAPFENEMDKYIHPSTAVTWKNCYVRAVSRMMPFLHPFRIPFFFVVYPFYYISASTKWLVLKSCKEPVWPIHIEEECRVEEGDPWRLPEPAYAYQFIETIPELGEWVLERQKETL